MDEKKEIIDDAGIIPEDVESLNPDEFPAPEDMPIEEIPTEPQV